MMAEDQRGFTCEDTHNIPLLMRNMCVRKEEGKPTMSETLKWCLSHGTGEPVFKDLRHLDERKATFSERRIEGVASDYLAECGFFIGQTGRLTCYQCGHWLFLQEGEDPVKLHNDNMPNCLHILRLYGKRPRPASLLGNLPKRQPTPRAARRRHMSDSLI